VKYTLGMPGELSPYQGEPTPENNKLWEDLYVGTKLVVQSLQLFTELSRDFGVQGIENRG
jgi:hypothetical protein